MTRDPMIACGYWRSLSNKVNEIRVIDPAIHSRVARLVAQAIDDAGSRGTSRFPIPFVGA